MSSQELTPESGYILLRAQTMMILDINPISNSIGTGS